MILTFDSDTIKKILMVWWRGVCGCDGINKNRGEGFVLSACITPKERGDGGDSFCGGGVLRWPAVVMVLGL